MESIILGFEKTHLLKKTEYQRLNRSKLKTNRFKVILVIVSLLCWTVSGTISWASSPPLQSNFPIEGLYDSQKNKKGDSLSFTFPNGYPLGQFTLPAGSSLQGRVKAIRPASRFHHGKIVTELETAWIPGTPTVPVYFKQKKHPLLILTTLSTLLDARADKHQTWLLLADLAVLPISLRGINSYIIPAGTEAVLGAAFEVMEPTTQKPYPFMGKALYGSYQGVLPFDPIYRFFKDKRTTGVNAKTAIIYKIDDKMLSHFKNLPAESVKVDPRNVNLQLGSKT